MVDGSKLSSARVLLTGASFLAISTVLGAVTAVDLRFTLDARQYPGQFGLASLPWLIAAVAVPGLTTTVSLLAARSRLISGRGSQRLIRWSLIGSAASVMVSLLGCAWVFAIQFSLPNNVPGWAWALGSSWPPSWYHETDQAFLRYAASLLSEGAAVIALSVSALKFGGRRVNLGTIAGDRRPTGDKKSGPGSVDNTGQVHVEGEVR